MPAVARGSTVDTVKTNHACCDATTTTEGASPSVFVEGTGVHREGHNNTLHTWPSCGCCDEETCPPHQTAISSASPTVYANGFGVARYGDPYDDGEEVSSGAETVFAD